MLVKKKSLRLIDDLNTLIHLMFLISSGKLFHIGREMRVENMLRKQIP
jgi:hypothetical protein